MAETRARRCAIWIDVQTQRRAEELAGYVGVDVDEFVAYMVNELHTHERREGREARGVRESASAEVIPMREEHRRRRLR
jgi:hypothetical protein